MAPRRSNRIKAVTAAAAAATAAATTAPSKRKQPTATSKKRKAKNASTPNKKMKKTGMKTTLNTSSSLGVVDPEANVENGTIEILDGEPCDCMLVLVDPAKHMDKFYVLQLIKGDDNVSAGAEEEYFVYYRWGRTGTSGQGQLDSHKTSDEAVKAFCTKFKEKTGLEWEKRDDNQVGDKYRFIQQNFAEKRTGYTSAKWQYWVDDGVDGKKTGWYDYDKMGSINVEQLFQENAYNPRLTNRSVESGIFTYDVDLSKMVQTNIKHHNKTSRRIRRYTGKEMDGDSPPPPIVSSSLSSSVSKPPPVKTHGLATATAVASTSAPVNIVTPTSSPTNQSQASTKKTGTPPVDDDIRVQGENSSDFTVAKNSDDEWYDVVLNQCNITGSSNNNKYYRLQLLEHCSDGTFHVWLKWGRVGEAVRYNQSQLHGPYDNEGAALKIFAKKYKDKTKNTWASGEEFVPVKGKYTRIEIDYDVEVSSDMMASPADGEVEYLKSTLDPKTKDLIEVLFSKETRDEALTNFNLDLKKLPLGVPSQQQIQNGVSILNNIEEKLNGDSSISDSYAELSSQFYTAIPHSFGRTKPPAISSTNLLQERYDMCNILLDMYSTNETVRAIQSRKHKNKKQVPYPADSHYETLKANLSPINSKSGEYAMIQEYFDKTKSSNSKMLNVWAVDRQGESERHQKFDKLDNRRLLWHGTNVAVAAPIITSGLRIMPHSGGRVGAGIYLASMQQKSAQYTSAYGAKFACMFLCEGALGKSHPVTTDGPHASRLKKAPKGSDSVHAIGSVTPKSWTTTTIDGKSVEIPNSNGHNSGTSSSFCHDEYLVYDEAQVRLRYVITVKL